MGTRAIPDAVQKTELTYCTSDTNVIFPSRILRHPNEGKVDLSVLMYSVFRKDVLMYEYIRLFNDHVNDSHYVL